MAAWGPLWPILDVEMYDITRCHSWKSITCLCDNQVNTSALPMDIWVNQMSTTELWNFQILHVLPFSRAHTTNNHTKASCQGHIFPSEMIFRVGKPRMPKRLPRKADWHSRSKTLKAVRACSHLVFIMGSTKTG